MPTHRRYRRNAVFVSDLARHSTPLDRNARAKLLFMAERIERHTKTAGQRNGCLGYTGLAVLRALVLRFANGRTGLCCPSYSTLRAHTGLCRQAIADALHRLEAAKIIRITRRIIWERVTRISPITGLIETYVGTVQTSSLYAFTTEADGRFVPISAPNPRPFPRRKPGSFLARLIGREAESTGQGGTT